MLYVFGDSWAAGAELAIDEKPFAPYLAELLDTPYQNLGICAASLGHILQTVIKEVDDMQSDDTVVVIIPPDIRWYYINEDYSAGSLLIGMPEYDDSYNIEWYIYHHSLFIYTIISLVTAKTKNLVLAHNYGKLFIPDMFTNKIDRTYLLSERSLTALLGAPDWLENYSTSDRKDGPVPENFEGKYFEGKDTHPNDLGHRQIAKIIYDKLQH
jgi:hypothetical protein